MKDLNTRHKADDVAVAQRLVMSAEVLHVGGPERHRLSAIMAG